MVKSKFSNTLKKSLLCLQDFRVSDESSAIILIFVHLHVMFLLFCGYLQDFLLIFDFQQFYYDVSRCIFLCILLGIIWASWIFLLSFINFGKFSAFLLSNILLPSSLSHLLLGFQLDLLGDMILSHSSIGRTLLLYLLWLSLCISV